MTAARRSSRTCCASCGRATCRHAIRAAHATADVLCGINVETTPLSRIVLDAVDAVVVVVMALRRDRHGVPAELASALGPIPVLHVAADSQVRRR
jgi:hypothetical protein